MLFENSSTEIGIVIRAFSLLLVLIQGDDNLSQYSATFSANNLSIQSNYDFALVLVSAITFPDLSGGLQSSLPWLTSFELLALLVLQPEWLPKNV
jgi:hypothetical protein